MELSPLRRFLALAVGLAAFISSPIEFSILEPALALIQQQYRVAEQNISWTYTLYAMAQMVGAPVMGKLSDARGRRDAFILTMGLFALGTMIAALSPNYLVLLAGRTVQGLGAGGIAPIATALMGDVVSPKRRGIVLSSLGVAVGMGLLAGPLIGRLALTIGWQTLFLVSAPILLGLGAAGYFLMPTREVKRAAPLDWRGLAVFVATIATFMFALVNLHPKALGVSPLVVGAFVLAAALLFIFVRMEQRTSEPFIRPDLFRVQAIVLACALALGYGLTRTLLSFLPEYVGSIPGETIAAAAVPVSLIALSIIISSPLAGILVDRIGVKPVVVGGLIIATTGTLLLSQFAGAPYLLIAGSILLGLGSSVLIGAPVRYLFLEEFPPEERATGQGLFAIMWTVGQQLSGVILGSLLAASGETMAGYSNAYLVIGLGLAALTLASLALPARPRDARAVVAAQAK